MGFIERNKIIPVFFLVLVSFFLMRDSFARVAPSKKNELSSLKQIKYQLKTTRKEITKLNLSIKKIEETLGKKNRKYISIVQERKRIEKVINTGKEQLNNNEEALTRQLSDSQNILKTLVLKRIETNKSPADLVANKVLITALVNKIKIIKNELRNNQSLKNQISKLESRYQEYVQVENNLSNLLYDLEENKRRRSEEFYEQVRNKKYLKSRYYQIKNEMKNKKKKVFPTASEISLLSPPLRSKKIRYKNKGEGVFFGYKGNKPVYAPGEGKVVYANDLSTYGKLIMIDHGNGYRSVILGKFKVLVKKGTKVKKNEKIGMTSPNWNKSGEIYFEVRKGSKIQLTSRMIDKIN